MISKIFKCSNILHIDKINPTLFLIKFKNNALKTNFPLFFKGLTSNLKGVNCFKF